jgi:acyl transferase domain-containing protein
VFLFPGRGVLPGRGARTAEPVFRAAHNECSRVTALDSADLALFAAGYATARLWQSWGIHPVAMAGHGIGEYVAATVAGVFPLRHALRLVDARGRLVREAAAEAAAAVPIAAGRLRTLLAPGVTVAEINGPELTTVSGPEPEIATLLDDLADLGVPGRRLPAAYARPPASAVEPFRRLVASVRRKPPRIPFVSTVTGDWITDGEAVDPDHWARHLREPVRFADAARALLDGGLHTMLEAGPGETLTGLIRDLADPRGRRPGREETGDLVSEIEPDPATPTSLAAQLELVRVALGADAVEFRDLTLRGPVTGTRPVRAVLAARGDGYAFTVTSGPEETPHAQGFARALPAAPVPGRLLHPALLDELGARVLGLRDHRPLAYGRLTVHAPLPSGFLGRVRSLDDGTGQVRAFDVTLRDPAGREVVGIGDVAMSGHL